MSVENIEISVVERGFTETDEKTKKLTRNIKELNNEVRSTTATFSLFGRIVAITALEQAATRILNLTDAYQNMQNRLKTVTESTNQMNIVSQRMLDIAQASRAPLESVATVFMRTFRAVQVLGKSQAETLVFTSTLTKAIQIGGSTSVEASNAMIQLSQGLSSGTLRGDELRSVLEQLPVVAQLIADKMGVTVGALRKLGAAGKLGSKEVFDAIVAGTSDIETKFAKMVPTVSQAWETVKNSALAASESFQSTSGKIAEALIWLSKNFDYVTDAVKALAIAITVGLVGKALTTLALSLSAQPWYALLTAIVAVTSALIAFADKIQVSADVTLTLQGAWDQFVKEAKEGNEGFASSLYRNFIAPLTNMEGLIGRIAMRWAKAYDMIRGRNSSGQTTEEEWGEWDSQQNWKKTHPNQAFPNSLRQNSGSQQKVLEFMQRAAAAEKEKKDNEKFLRDKAANDPIALAAINRKGPDKSEPNQIKSSGKNADDVLRELLDTLVVLRTKGDLEMQVNKKLEAAIDSLGKGQTVEGYGSKKSPFTLAPNSNKAAWLDEYNRTGKIPEMGSNGKLPGEVRKTKFQKMEDAIRQQVALVQGKAEEEKLDKEISDRLDEQQKIETDIVKMMEKKSIEAGKYQVELLKQAKEKTAKNDKGIEADLDPVIKYNEEVRKLLDFETRNPQYHDAVQKKIDSMNEGYKTFVPIMDNVGQSIADAAANALVFGDNMETALVQIGKAAAAQGISKGIGLLTDMAIGGKSMPGIGDGISAGTRATSAATAAELSANTSPYGFASGGYTGNYGTDEIAGVVHGKEMVINAKATARNRPMLESMNSGSGMGSSGGMKVDVHNYVGAEVEVRQGPTPGEIQVMIKKGIQKMAPQVIANDMNNPNSQTSKALNRNTEASRRR